MILQSVQLLQELIANDHNATGLKVFYHDSLRTSPIKRVGAAENFKKSDDEDFSVFNSTSAPNGITLRPARITGYFNPPDPAAIESTDR
jgi:hypothetical protein